MEGEGKLSVSYSIVSLTASAIVKTILYEKKCINRKLREKFPPIKRVFLMWFICYSMMILLSDLSEMKSF